MALRPVSELGLVEVTDIAGGAGQPTAAPHSPKQARRSRAAKPARATSAGSKKRTRPSAGPLSGSPSRTSSRPGRTAGTDARPQAANSGLASIRTSVLSGAMGVAGAVLVGRAILRR